VLVHHLCFHDDTIEQSFIPCQVKK
jgi:hypothetical protein